MLWLIAISCFVIVLALRGFPIFALIVFRIITQEIPRSESEIPFFGLTAAATFVIWYWFRGGPGVQRLRGAFSLAENPVPISLVLIGATLVTPDTEQLVRLSVVSALVSGSFRVGMDLPRRKRAVHVVAALGSSLIFAFSQDLRVILCALTAVAAVYFEEWMLVHHGNLFGDPTDPEQLDVQRRALTRWYSSK